MTKLFLIIIAVVILVILLSRRGRYELRSRLDTGGDAFIGICEAAATRYFDELEKEGKVRQVGKTGRHVHYERT